MSNAKPSLQVRFQHGHENMRSIQVGLIPAGVDLSNLHKAFDHPETIMVAFSTSTIDGLGSCPVVVNSWVSKGVLQCVEANSHSFFPSDFANYTKDDIQDRISMFTARPPESDNMYVNIDDSGRVVMSDYPAALWDVYLKGYWAIAYWLVSAKHLSYDDEGEIETNNLSNAYGAHGKKEFSQMIEGVELMNIDSEMFIRRIVLETAGAM